MKKRRIFIGIFLLIVTVFWVSARDVEYDYYFDFDDYKDIQQMWVIKTDNDISITDRTYVIDTNFEWTTIIPKYTSLEQKLIDKFWFEKLDYYISKHYLEVWNSNYRFIPEGKENVSPKVEYFPIIEEEKKELLTNAKHKRVLRITSNKDQTVKLRLYSVSPDYFTWWIDAESLMGWYYDNLLTDPRLLTIFDTTQEYYNLKWYISNILSVNNINKYDNEPYSNSKIEVEKKYELINFKRILPNWKSRDTKSYIPYYELEFDVKKWMNNLDLTYEGYIFKNFPIQIK